MDSDFVLDFEVCREIERATERKYYEKFQIQHTYLNRNCSRAIRIAEEQHIKIRASKTTQQQQQPKKESKQKKSKK